MPGNELVIESCKNRNREHQKTKTKEKDNAKQGKYRVKNSNLILQITTGIPYQGRVVYVKEEQAEEAKKRIADWEKKGEFPEPLRTQSHTPKARIAALIWVIIIGVILGSFGII